MTISRFDGKDTEFGDWLRHQPELDSRKGFVATDIDYLWRTTSNSNPEWMIIEEKRHRARMKKFQAISLLYLDFMARAMNDNTYRGFHLLQFENTSPEDGKIFLDGKEVTNDDLIKFLAFEQPEDWYKSYHPNGG